MENCKNNNNKTTGSTDKNGGEICTRIFTKIKTANDQQKLVLGSVIVNNEI